MSEEWIKIRIPAEKLLEYIEKYLRERRLKYKVKKYYRNNTLRIINIKIGFFKKITIHAYYDHCYVSLSKGLDDLKNILNYFPKHIERETYSPKTRREIERAELLIKAQIFEAKARNAKLGLIIALISSLILSLLLGLHVLIILIFLLLLIPFGYSPYTSEGRYGIPILYFWYKSKARKYRIKAEKLED